MKLAWPETVHRAEMKIGLIKAVQINNSCHVKLATWNNFAISN